MVDDFRKYATKHLGMSSMVLDDVMKSQAGYLNPYISSSERPISLNMFTEDSTPVHPEKESCSTTFAGPGGKINSQKPVWSQEDT